MSAAATPLPAAVIPLHRSTGGTNAFVDRLMTYAPMLAATVFSKISVPPFGAQGIALAVPVPSMVIFVQAIRGALMVHPGRLALFLLLIVISVLMPTLQGEYFSLPSVAMMVVLYLPFAFHFPKGAVSFDDARDALLALCTLVALLGIAQFALQPFLPRHLLFPMEYHLPEFLKLGLFANEGPLAWGSDMYRANGVVMLEPSVFSQLMAVGAIVELCTRNRYSRVLLFLAALLVSYSGTGIMALAIALPVLVISQRRWDVLIFACVVAVLLSALAPFLNLEIFLNRSDELSSTGSSGYARFVGGFWMFSEFSLDSVYRSLFGFGPGSMRGLIDQSAYRSAEMTLFKTMMELGLTGTLLFCGYVIWSVFDNAAPLAIKFVLIAIFFLGGSFTPFFHGLALSLLVWPHHPLPVKRVAPLSGVTP